MIGKIILRQGRIQVKLDLGSSLAPHVILLTLTIWPNMMARGQKSQFSNFSAKKTWKYNLGFSKIQISHLLHELGKTWKYTQPQTNISKSKCWIYGWVGKTCPKLSFTVENKMGNSHKKGWSHFKVNINDWEIPFPKILRIY